MFKLLKWGCGIGCLTVIVVGAAALVIAHLTLNSAIETGIETLGPKVTGTSITLESVAFRPLTGSCRLKGLRVGNPDGYETDHSFVMDEVRIELEPKSLLGDKLVINKIHIYGPEITYEKKLMGSNIDEIRGNVDKFVESIAGTGEGEEAPESEGAGMKLQVNEFVLKDAKVKASAGFLKGKSIPLSIPEIRMNDLGADEEGITIGELIGETMKALVKSIGPALKKAAGSLKEGVGDLGEPGGDIKDKVKEGAGKAVDKLRGLLNKGD